MARYQSDHKPKTRSRIVEVAGRLFRRHGYDGVSIDAIMETAGLTRGGFYGHFKSKRDLFNAVVAGDHEFITRLADRPGKTKASLRRQGIEVARGYLAPENRRGVAGGCSIAALAVEAARGKPATRRAYSAAVDALIAEFNRGLGDSAPHDARSIEAIALCVGGLLLSSACDDRALADRISEVCGDAAASALAAGG